MDKALKNKSDDVLAFSTGMRLQWEKAQNAYVLLYPEGMIRLNESAGEVLKRIDGKRSIKGIVNELLAEFEEDESSLAEDVFVLLDGAVSRGWLSRVAS